MRPRVPIAVAAALVVVACVAPCARREDAARSRAVDAAYDTPPGHPHGRVHADAAPPPPPPPPRAAPVDAPHPVSFEGLVLDAATGAGVGGALVARGDASTTSRADGSFALTCGGGCECVTARAEGCFDAETDCNAEARSASGRVRPLFLRRIVRRIPGRIVDWRGRVAAGISVHPDEGDGVWVSADDGTFGPVPVAAGRGLRLTAAGCDSPQTERWWSAPDLRRAGELTIRLRANAGAPLLVVDASGAPVAGVTLTDLHSPDLPRVTTDAAGHAVWPLPPGGEAVLSATKGEVGGGACVAAGVPARIVVSTGGWWHASQSPPPPPEPRTSPPPTTTRVLLAVVDARGAPVAGAYVEIRCDDGEYETWDITAANGTCEIDAPDRPFRLSARDGARHEGRSLALGDATTMPPRVVLPMPAARREEATEPRAARIVTGVVVDAAGLPVPDAHLQAAGRDDCDTTDDAGRFAVPVAAGLGTIRLLVEVGCYAPLFVDVPGDGGDVSVRLPPRGRLDIDTPQSDDPACDYVVFDWRADDVRLLWGFTEPELLIPDGERASLWLPEGTWDVAFRRPPGDWVLWRNVAIAASPPTTRRYALPHAGALRGTVRDAAGMPLEDATVVLPASGQVLAYVDEFGAFDADRDRSSRDWTTPVMTTRLLVLASGHVATFTEPVDLGRDVTLDARPVSSPPTHGRVVRAGGGLPAGATVLWRPEGRGAACAATTEPDGSFAFEVALPPGRARLSILLPRRDRERVAHDVDVDVTIPPDASPLRIEIP